MKIEITQQDIDNGIKGRVSGCAIAVALKQEFAYEVGVSSWIRIGKDYYLALPEVIRWFSAFDRGEPVKPITIDLALADVPREYHPKVNPKATYPYELQVCGVARIVDSHQAENHIKFQ